MRGYTIPKEIKNEILEKVHRGEKIGELTKEYGLGGKTIYTWLKKESTSGVNILEVSRLKRENEALKILVGELSLSVSLGKKKKGHF